MAFAGNTVNNDSGSEHNSGNSMETHQNVGGTMQKRESDETDGGSGSTVKKMSKKDKIKNFFKKHT